MIDPPLISDEVLDYWRYMNRCNPDGTRTPLSRPDVTRLFGYIQLLEERLTERGGSFGDLREFLGLGKGIDGSGIASRAEVRKRLRALERRRTKEAVHEQRHARLGKLPLYTARFEARTDTGYIGSIDEMPGVFSQGASLASCIANLAGSVAFARRGGRPNEKRRQGRRRVRRAQR